jgi:hypothetical protein
MKIITLFFFRYPIRFVLFYWLCFIFPFPFSLIVMPFQLIEPKDQPAWMKVPREYIEEANGWIYKTSNDVIKRVGPYLSQEYPVVIQGTGSGDTMRNYVGCFCAAVLAAGLALAWSIIIVLLHLMKVPWKGDAWLHGTTRVIVRFFLILMLFGYGFAKVFPMQFSQPTSLKLSEQLGDMSPMGLLWTMMGFSIPYQMFTGAVEVLAGFLLIFRRTTFLGALVTIGAMTQVFALNMCFDVPVKLYSLHYLVMGIFLAIPDLPRLFSVMVLGRAAEPKAYPPLLGNKWCGRVGMLIRLLVVGLFLYSQISFGYTMWFKRHGGPPAPVKGHWEKVTLQIDGKDVDPNDVLNWKSLDFTNKAMVRITGPKPPMMVYNTTWNPDEKKLTLGKFTDDQWSAEFTYNLPTADKLELTGKMDGKAIKGTFKLIPEKKTELMNREFHWIQEMPYNR